MGFFSRKEFAQLCHTTTPVVTTNINRGKIVVEDKKIDSEHPLNKAFFDKYAKKAQESIKKKTDTKDLYKEVVHTIEQKSSDEVSSKFKSRSRKKEYEKAQEAVDWDVRKKKAEALLKERQAEKEKFNLEKLAGKLMPTEMVFDIIRTHNRSIFATFQNDIENLASVYCDILAAGDRRKLSELTQALSEHLSDVIKRAGDVAKSGVENAVEAYAETRNRGERK